MKILHLKVDDKALLVVIIEKSNLERMRAGDPASFTGGDFPEIASIVFSNMDVWVCYEENLSKVYGLMQRGDEQGCLKYLSRSWQMKDDDGSMPVVWRP